MTPKSFFIFILCSLLAAVASSSEVVDLDTTNFEHLTQASTGHTTGDWLVKFYAPWCGHCKTLAPILEEVADELKGIVNVAKVDVMQSRDLGERFNIKGFPTVKLFSKGKIYTFEGRRSVEDLVAYAKGGFADKDSEDVPKEVGYFGGVTRTLKMAYKEASQDVTSGNYFTPNVFLMVLPFVFALIFFLLVMMPSGAEEIDTAKAVGSIRAKSVVGTEKED